jgi:hypothetical protein
MDHIKIADPGCSLAVKMEKELVDLAALCRDGQVDKPSPLLYEMREFLFRTNAGNFIRKNDKRERSVKMKVWGKHRLKISLYQ